ncbi:ABC transporter substrate-binding protein [Elstera cyanobacteriorum]|uniref:ABC transporter substrate-binding protein n=1 Tax=Elstera cyanobacteriorum TaxID=2022747 RepID=UPI002355877F|nr:ABC transporter substrate-binding protein [Elstera cyanobacteriorum]MCK6442514.1 ABC transporter substrate-binding protein [Elstera cyanobacteriorum]
MVNVKTLLASAALSAALALPAYAQVSEVVIGVIEPMSGAGAQTGIDAKAAMETALDIINEDIDIGLPLGPGAGLPKLGGAKIKLVFADHQADPQKGRAEAERLITENKVSAIIGAYHSAVAAVVSQVAERYQVPFLAADSSSPSLHRRNLKWFFRTSAHDEMFSQAMFDFYKDMKEKKNITVDQVAMFYEDTIFGTDSSNIQRKLAGDRGIKVAGDIKYRANSPSLTSEVQQLKSSGAPVLMPSSYTTDAILLLKTMGELGYKPQGIVAQAAGFAEQAFLQAVGDKAEGIISRSSFSLDLSEKRPMVAKVNEMYKKRSGKDLNDNSARQLMAVLVMADAIDRAGSIKNEDIRGALQKTDIPGDKTIMPWANVRFDENGQNTGATPVLIQVQDGVYRSVWPFETASRPVVWPIPAR